MAGAAALALSGALAGFTRLHVTGHAQGLFLLRPARGSRLEVTDDLFLGEGSRLVASLTF